MRIEVRSEMTNGKSCIGDLSMFTNNMYWRPLYVTFFISMLNLFSHFTYII